MPLIAALRPHAEQAARVKRPDELLFAGPDGGRLTHHNLRRAIGRDAPRAAIGRPDLRMHDLRHTFTTILFDGGASVPGPSDRASRAGQWPKNGPRSPSRRAKQPLTRRNPLADQRVLRGGSDRRRSGDLTIFSRALYQLSYRARAILAIERPRRDLNPRPPP